ncbi:Hydroxypyruvate reductase-like protein [Drosera capensis]
MFIRRCISSYSSLSNIQRRLVAASSTTLPIPRYLTKLCLKLHLQGIDVNAATKYGIKVVRLPGDVTGNAASCAEMAIYLMLGLLRKQIHLRNSIKQKKLGEPVGDNLIGKHFALQYFPVLQVFIMRFGNIGLELAKRLKPFGVKIIATKRSFF